ncbi:MAG: glycosyltransferase family 4 protein [Methylococcaceae bacterium]
MQAYPKNPKIKLGMLVSHPIQYFVPVYRQLAKTEGIDLTVLYRTRVGVDAYHDPGFDQIVKWDIPLLDGYKHEFLSSKNKIEGVQWRVISELVHNRFDVLLLHGYNSFTNIAAIIVAKFLGTKVLMRGDTRIQPNHKMTGLKAYLKRMLFNYCNGFVTIGSLNRAYYEQLGVPSDRLYFAPFCVQNDAFAVLPDLHKRYRLELRETLNLASDSLIVLFASKLIKRKSTEDLIQAFARIADVYPAAYLVIAGSGDEENHLRQLAASINNLQIRFIGFQNQSQLPKLYAASDIFVLPSHSEPWGLVINEVMAAGLPVIVSSEVGAAPDLVEGKGTGIVFPWGDVQALASAIEMLLKSPTLRLEMGTNARQLINNWNVAMCASGIVEAATKLMH